MEAQKSSEAEEAIIKQYTELAHEITSKFRSLDSEDYKDAFQHAQLGILKAHREYDETRGVKFITVAWKYAYNAVRKYNRANKGLIHIPHNSNESSPSFVEFSPEYSSNAHEELDTVNVKLVLRNAIESLSQEEKLVISSTYNLGESAAEIADKLGWDVNKVYKTTQKALKKLKANFSDKNMSIEDFL